MTVQKGKEYGEGKLLGGKTDNSNTYDNYFILRGAKWASQRYNTKEGGKNLEKTNYTPSNLRRPINENEAKKYLDK